MLEIGNSSSSTARTENIAKKIISVFQDLT